MESVTKIGNPETKETKPKKKIKWWKLSLQLIGAGTLVAVGVIGGKYVGRIIFQRHRDYSKYTVEKQDYSKVYETYEKTSPSMYTSKFSGTELVNIGLLNISKSNEFYAVTRGKVRVDVLGGINQDILQTFIKSGDSYYEEDLSKSSAEKAGFRFYQTGNEEVTVYEASSVSREDGDLLDGDYSKSEPEVLSAEDFAENWGRETLADPIVYHINDQTVLDSTVKKENGLIKVGLELEPILSVLKYVRQMKSTGGLSYYPDFSRVHIDFVLDENLYIQSFTTDEDYVATSKKFPLPVDSSGTLTMEYVYSHRDIPTMEEKSNFVK